MILRWWIMIRTRTLKVRSLYNFFTLLSTQMKNFLIITSLCLFSTVFYAQKDKIIYLDSLNFETNYGNHTSYRVIQEYNKNKRAYNVLDYYKSGKLKAEGIYADNLPRVRQGITTAYYENGNKKSRTMYTEGLEFGEYMSWHENGTKAIEGEYIINNYAKTPESNLKINNYWDENGNQTVINGNGTYHEITETESATGSILDGCKTGLWEGKNSKAKITFKETYKNGKLIDGIASDENKSYSYTKIEIQANPKKGLPAFYKEFATSVHIPEVKEGTTSIKLLFRFVIDKAGNITDIKIVRGFNNAVDSAFMATMKRMPSWNPAYLRGKVVESRFTLPITIQTN